MTVLVVVLFGCGAGAGLWLMLRPLLGSRPVSLAQLDRELGGVGVAADAAEAGRESQKVGGLSLIAERLPRRMSPVKRAEYERRLRLVAKSEAEHTTEKLALALVGFVLPVVTAAGMATAGIGLPLPVVLIAAAAAAVGGFLYPDLPLAEQAENRAREFRFALGAYLDFVTIMLAGGAGTQSALEAAAEAGDGWAFAELRRAIGRASATGTSTWSRFDELGRDLGVVELEELAASVALAGGQGGRVKESLGAKAEALRLSQRADVEAMSESRTEKMIVPVVVLIAGLVLFIGFGAVDVIAGGSAPVPAGQSASD